MGFSPHAILSEWGASGNFISGTVFAETFLRVTPLPPNKFAEPGKTWKVVTPPAKASLYCGSWDQTLCSAQTSAVTGFVASLPSLLVLTPGAG